MWRKTILLLLQCVEAVVSSQCWQGATFSEAVVSPSVDSSGILRVPGVSSLPQCVAACCDLPGYDLAWLFKGRCYVLSCQQKADCHPRDRRGADSILVFLRRPTPQTLVLQSLVRGEPYGSRWKPLSRSSEAPGDLQALKDLALFDGPQQDFSDPGVMDVEYSEENQEGEEPERLTDQERDQLNQSDAEEGPEGWTTEMSPTQNTSLEETSTRRTTEDPPPVEKTTETQSSTEATSLPPSSQKPTADPTHPYHIRTSVSSTAAPDWPISSSSASSQTVPPLSVSFGNPATQTTSSTIQPEASVRSEPTADTVKISPTPKEQTTQVMTSDPTTTSAPSTTAPPITPAQTVSEVRESNRGPVAVVGPDRKLFLPVSSVLLDGRGSTDDHGIIRYHWDAVSGPPGLILINADEAVATATGLRMGRYIFRLTVSDQQGATDNASLTVGVHEVVPPPPVRTLPPVAHASGSHTLTLPNNSLVLRGSVTDGDQTELHFLWVRDGQSPAAGDVLYASDTQASLYLANLVEGTYLFQLRVTDAQGRSSTATATVEVQPEPGGGEEVELEMQVSVSQVSVSQRNTVVRQLAALLHVLNGDIQVRGLQGHSHLSTVLRFSVRGPSGPVSGSRLVALLRNQLLREKSDYLLFRVLRVDTVLCLLQCSGRGQCDPITKQCACDPFWTENLIRRYFGDGESNCEWRVLYAILSSFILMVFILSVSWTFICCCKRKRQTKVRKKTKYTILDNMDEQERVELRPKFSIKHRSTEHNSSLMMSESELDSDQDTIFSRDRPVRSRNRISSQAARNGNAFG